MKISKMILMAGAVFALASCGGNEEVLESVEVDMASYTVDTENSSLGWKGMKTADYYHTGTVKFSEGSAEFIDGAIMSGSFTLDMTTIAVTDELPDEKKAMLIGHLGTDEFLNVAKNQTIVVTCGLMMGDKLPITINMSGMEIKQDVPVTITNTDGQASITGKFDVDFSALNAVGFQPEEGEEEHVQPVISFDLNLMLK